MYFYLKKQVGGACRDIPGKEPPFPRVRRYDVWTHIMAAERHHRLDFSDLRWTGNSYFHR